MTRALIALVVLLLAGCATPVPVITGPVTPPSADVPAMVLPASIEVPAIDARSELMLLGVDAANGVEEPPETSPGIAGWYKYSPVPGQRGAPVILGHINGDGQRGVFADLVSIEPGDEVFVDLTDGTRVTYRIDRVQQIAKTVFPTQAVYGPVGGSEIRLVSCGGPFDDGTGHYLDNVIAYGTMV